MTTVALNGIRIEVKPRDQCRWASRFSEVASSKHPVTGETLRIFRDVTNPFVFRIAGDKLAAMVNVASVFQEAAIHIEARNAGGD